MKFSRDAAISRIPAPHLLKQGKLQLAGASFRDIYSRPLEEMNDLAQPNFVQTWSTWPLY